MHVYKRYDSEKRLLSAPLLFYALEDEIEQLKEDPEWQSRHRNAVTLVKEPHMSVVLVVLHKGAKLERHRTSGPITILVLAGSIRVGAEADSRAVHRNGMVALEKAIPHDVVALEDSAVLVTIARPEV